MTVKIGEKIKELRQENNVTQEKLAEYIGVTAQAISRWESEVCYPDIELLPTIANFFDVTIDDIFSSNKFKNEVKIKEINEQVHEKWNKGLIDEALGILRRSVQEFPTNYDLLHTLAWLIHSKGRRKSGEDKQKDLHEAISIYERILSDCLNDSVRYGVLQKLAYAYNDMGEKQKALETAMKLPSEPCTSNSVLTGIYKGDELHQHFTNNIRIFAGYLASDLNQFGCDNDVDIRKRIELHKKSIGIYELIYENGDYGFYNCRLAEYYMDLAKCYITSDNIESTLDCLEKSLKYAVAYDTLTESKHTSVIFKGETYNLSGVTKQYSYNDCYRLLHDFGLTEEKFNSIKDNERYKAVLAEFEKYANLQ